MATSFAGPAAPLSAVFDVAQALDNPFVQRTGMITTVAHPDNPQLRVLSNPIKINGQRLDQQVCSPLGGDNETFM